MKLKGVIVEDFINYNVPCMTLEFPTCSFKCDKECGQQVCQNSSLVQMPTLDIDLNYLINLYLNDPITEAICCQGLEPLDSLDELIEFLDILRKNYLCQDDIVIYTGYTKEELSDNGILSILNNFKPIIIKYGRYIPNWDSHYDSILKVNLASPNQYAEIL